MHLYIPLLGLIECDVITSRERERVGHGTRMCVVDDLEINGPHGTVPSSDHQDDVNRIRYRAIQVVKSKKNKKIRNKGVIGEREREEEVTRFAASAPGSSPPDRQYNTTVQSCSFLEHHHRMCVYRRKSFLPPPNDSD